VLGQIYSRAGYGLAVRIQRLSINFEPLGLYPLCAVVSFNLHSKLTILACVMQQVTCTMRHP
jgi:hypothetical protein